MGLCVGGGGKESAANGFSQLIVVSPAYTSATKSEEQKRSREGERLRGTQQAF